VIKKTSERGRKKKKEKEGEREKREGERGREREREREKGTVVACTHGNIRINRFDIMHEAHLDELSDHWLLVSVPRFASG